MEETPDYDTRHVGYDSLMGKRVLIIGAHKPSGLSVHIGGTWEPLLQLQRHGPSPPPSRSPSFLEVLL